MQSSTKQRGLVVAALTAVLLLTALAPAGAHPLARWWQYEMETWTHTWKSVPKLRHADNRWHNNNPDAVDADVRNWHNSLTDRFRQRNFNRASGTQRGQASWFSASHGYCTPRTTGYYAASRTLPCGTRVSVRSGDRYVIVTIQDRGPYVSGRILDLSKAAFRKLAPLGSGVISVTATRLRGK